MGLVAAWYVYRGDVTASAVATNSPVPVAAQAPVTAVLPPPIALQPAARPAASRPAVAAVAGPAVPAADPVLTLGSLPADAPRLSISGSVYSQSPGQRLLIVNGAVFNEGAEIAAGVVLEQIRPKAAILRFRDVRYLIAY